MNYNFRIFGFKYSGTAHGIAAVLVVCLFIGSVLGVFALNTIMLGWSINAIMVLNHTKPAFELWMALLAAIGLTLLWPKRIGVATYWFVGLWICMFILINMNGNPVVPMFA